MPSQSRTTCAATADAPTPGRPEGTRVRAMFDRIAGRYDLLNHVLSLQLDRRWRARTARRLLGRGGNPRVLDLCSGTGDLSLALAAACRGARVFSGDFSLPMLAVHRGKDRGARVAAVDALALPFAPGSFDALSVAFGVRNWSDRRQGFAEVLRVLAPGGRFAILEFSRPPEGWFGRVFRWYSRHVLPRIGAWISRSPEAYDYLPRSMERFLLPAELSAELRTAGFEAVEHESLAFGTVALHLAQRPGG